MKHTKLRNVQQFDGGFTDLFILGVTDLTVNTAGAWTKQSDFTAAATSQTQVLLNLNVGDFVHPIALVYVENTLTGGGVTAATLSVGPTSATTSFLNAQDMFTNPVASGGCFITAAGATPYITQAASKQLLATLGTTGGNLSGLTTGRIWIYTRISRVADFMDAPSGNRVE